MVWLQGEMFEDLLPLESEESSHALYFCQVLKELSVFNFSTFVWIVSHEVFSEEDTWVETLAN